MDRRSDASVHAVAAELAGRPMSSFSPHAGLRGRFGHLGITLEALNVVATRGSDPDYLSLLTGQDYPIKAPDRVEERLHAAVGASFLEGFDLPRWPGIERAGAARRAGVAHGGMDPG